MKKTILTLTALASMGTVHADLDDMNVFESLSFGTSITTEMTSGGTFSDRIKAQALEEDLAIYAVTNEVRPELQSRIAEVFEMENSESLSIDEAIEIITNN